ncbi:unnamed protein product [Phyllotreta striolata]|uniref:Protein I'm not dead yet n=1 Tax=Phyllotreta striolata TaxID=444603 RepID=A0A9N9XQ76_PHYSR|nr:unnamed protein product [Phyllotreta striolata]
MLKVFKFLIIYWKTLFTLIFPIITLPIFLCHDTKANRCMYCFALMSAFWMTECIPAAITSILPMIIFPLLGVLNSDAVARSFLNDTTMMLIGSVAIAIAMEATGLHVRIALYVIKFIGCSFCKLHIGLGMVTMFISMWIANTAATALMIPIVEGILVALQNQGLITMWKRDDSLPPEDWKPTNVTKCYYITSSYSSLIGGTGCIIGSGSHLAYKGLYETLFPDSPGVEFSKWMLFNVPLMLISNIFILLWLQILYLGLFRPYSQTAKDLSTGKEAAAAAKVVIDQKIVELGPLKFAEIAVAVVFVLSIVFWFLRRPGFMKGWPDYVSDVKCGDAVVAIAAFVLFFIIPMEPTFVHYCSQDEAKRPTESSKGVLEWKPFSSKMHWNMLLVLGGGFAMSDAAKQSGMTTVVANYLQTFLTDSNLLNLIIVCFTGSVITQFLSSNVACVTIMTPILLDICILRQTHPMWLGLSNALACCYSYFLPVSTPPNALVSGPARMGGKEMMVSGCGTYLACMVPLLVIFPLYAPLIWDFTFPEWANVGNNTQPEF